MNTLFIAILWCVVQVTLLALLAALVYLLARRFGPRAGATAIVSTLSLTILLTLLAGSPWPRWQLPENSAVAQTPAIPSPVLDALPHPPIEAPLTPPQPSEGYVPPATEQPAPSDHLRAFWSALATPSSPAVSPRTPTWKTAAAFTLLAGATLCLLRLVIGVGQVVRFRLRSEPLSDPHLATLASEVAVSLGYAGEIELRESPSIVTPATVGWWRPAILLPTPWHDWDDATLRAVVAHEMAHVAGRDFASWIIARGAVALHFYHPLVHWLARRLQLEQELAADAAAVEVVGDRTAYLHTLARLALATPDHSLTGPARTLIPSRSLLTRRVEMLRATPSTTISPTATRRTSIATCGLLALLCLAVAGLRGPAVSLAQDSAPAAEASPEVPQKVERIGLEMIPADTLWVGAIRPMELFSLPEMKELGEHLGGIAALKASGVKVSQIAEAMAIASKNPSHPPRFIIRFTSPAACQKISDYVAAKRGMQPLTNREISGWEDDRERVVRFDSSTLIIDPVEREHRETLPALKHRPPAWSDEWQHRSDSHIALAFDALHFRQTLLPRLMEEPGGSALVGAIKPLADQTELVLAGIQLGEELKIEGLAIADNAESAIRVGKTLEALLQLADNLLQYQRKSLVEANPEPQRQTVSDILNLGQSILTKSKVEVTDSRVTLTYTGDAAALTAVEVIGRVVLPAVEAAQEAARRNTSLNNLKHLAIGMQSYHDAYKKLPSAVIRKAGQPPHSWRVAILPYLNDPELVELHSQYRFDEPWDSEANKNVLAKMPSIFRDPGDTSPDPTATSYFALTGPTTMFEGDEGISFRQVTDGLSRTILLVEAKRNIPWTKPEDIPYSPDHPLPEFGGNHPDLFLAALADGSAQVFTSDISAEFLRAMITRNQGETDTHPPTPIYRPAQPAASDLPMGSQIPTESPTPGASPTVPQRP